MARRAERVGVVVMGKVPQPGRSKTRLIGPLDAGEAAELASAMLADRCAQVAALEGVVPSVALVRSGDAPPAGAFAPPGFRALPQPEGGLGACLEAAAEALLNEGLPVVLVDADSPTLPTAYLQRAVDRLRAAGHGAREAVLGPTEDGGYYLVGLCRAAPRLFRDMPWSTPEVAAQTLARARADGLDVLVLPPWWDVDRPADLERLRGHVLEAHWPLQVGEWLRAREERYRSQGPGVAPPVARIARCASKVPAAGT